MLSAYSIEKTKAFDAKYKKEHGIFFTPKSVRDLVFEQLKDIDPERILEPSAGSGEFVDDCRRIFPNATVVGVELDPSLAKDNGFVNEDFLKWESDDTFDLIIGNPPFVQRPRGFASDSACVKGRSNVYIEFIYKCLTKHLSRDGVLAFVVPATIGNSAFYEPTRKLLTRLDILLFKILDVHDFAETNTRICILIVRNSPGSGRFVYDGFLCEHPPSASDDRIGNLDITFKTGFCHAHMKPYISASGDIPFFTNRDIGSDRIVTSDKTRYVENVPMNKMFSGRCLLVKTASAGRRGGRFEFGFAFYEGVFSADNDVIVVRGNDVDKVYSIIRKRETANFVDMLVTNGHLNMKLLRSIPTY